VTTLPAYNLLAVLQRPNPVSVLRHSYRTVPVSTLAVPDGAMARPLLQLLGNPEDEGWIHPSPEALALFPAGQPELHPGEEVAFWKVVPAKPTVIQTQHTGSKRWSRTDSPGPREVHVSWAPDYQGRWRPLVYFGSYYRAYEVDAGLIRKFQAVADGAEGERWFSLDTGADVCFTSTAAKQVLALLAEHGFHAPIPMEVPA
jgi:hypothetical protein